MSCTSPLKRWVLGIDPDTGKTLQKVTSYNVSYLWKLPNGNFDQVVGFGNYSTKDNFRNSKFYIDNSERIILDSMDIRCGKCSSCRIDKSREWALRCMMESLYHKDNCFVTLTYNDENLPPCHNEAVNYETGELCEKSPIHSLVYDHVRKFMRDLRRHEEYHHQTYGIRFFGCGEYGPLNFRPHYHIILFGFKPDDIVAFKKNHMGQVLYRSPTLEKIWKKGFVSVGECNFETAAYTARYITKKFLGESNNVYTLADYTPEFSCMSRKGGIGKQYFEDHKDDIYKFDEIILNRGLDRSIKGKPPRYFDYLYDLDHPDEMEEIKDKRKELGELNRKLAISKTGLTWEQILRNRNTNLQHKFDMLKREL